MSASPTTTFLSTMFLGDEADGAKSSVSKAAALLSAFGSMNGSATLTELARTAEVPKSTAHRLLGILRTAGLVDREADQWYLTSVFLRLGALAFRGAATVLREAALPHMVELYEFSHENVHLATLEDGEVVYLEKLYGRASTASPSRVGFRSACHTSALGKAMLSMSDNQTIDRVLSRGLRPATRHSIVLPGMLMRQLAIARTERIAFDREESREGLICIASPVLGPSGKAVAAISVAGSAKSIRQDDLVERVRKAAEEITRKAGPDIELMAVA